MKGFVYIISNKSFPELVKIGYSTKDPKFRAKKFNNTGVPHRYTVDYAIQIEEPFLVEQKTHKILSAKKENKEWFRCSKREAIAAIEKAAAAFPVLHDKVRVISPDKREEVLGKCRQCRGTRVLEKIYNSRYSRCKACGDLFSLRNASNDLIESSGNTSRINELNFLKEKPDDHIQFQKIPSEVMHKCEKCSGDLVTKVGGLYTKCNSCGRVFPLITSKPEYLKGKPADTQFQEVASVILEKPVEILIASDLTPERPVEPLLGTFRALWNIIRNK